jgi:hypothetical protein
MFSARLVTNDAFLGEIYLISDDPNAAGSHYFFTPETKYLIQLRTYVVCGYNDSWWVGRINVKDIKDPLTNEILIAFMHPQGPSSAFYWP